MKTGSPKRPQPAQTETRRARRRTPRSGAPSAAALEDRQRPRRSIPRPAAGAAHRLPDARRDLRPIFCRAGKDEDPQRPPIRPARPGAIYGSGGPFPLPAPAALTPPPALESFRGLAPMPRTLSNARIFPRSDLAAQAPQRPRSDRPARTWPELRPKNKGLRCPQRGPCLLTSWRLTP